MVTTSRLRQRSSLAVAALVALLLATLAVPVQAAAGRWIVPAGAPLPTGSMVVGSFPVADALVVFGPTAPVGGVAYDTVVGTHALPGVVETFGEGEDAFSVEVDTAVAATNAVSVWRLGELGEQAVVALVDTGVAPVPALEGAVAGEIDFTGTGGGDGYGHGTFLASLIAGRGAVAPGVAPEAGILSLKVGTSDGTATLGSVVSALQWLHGPGSAAGLRIATLALGVDPGTDAANILDHAADALARKGVMVITASGNDPEVLSSPATATRTVSVGAYDDHGTADTADDTPSDFSGQGPDRAGVTQPDVTAPGQSVVGSMPHGSAIAAANPASWVGGYEGNTNLFRGTGTSMATALTAGVAALASSARPDLDGDALAAAVVGQGGGRPVDALGAVNAALAAPQGKPVNSPPWAEAPGEQGPGQGRANSNGKAAEAEPNGLRWTGLRWTGLRWTGLRWTGLRWTGLRWTGLRWTGLRWTGTHWGDEAWAPGAWGGLRWTGKGWAGDEPDPSPHGLRWTGLRWTGLRWTGLRWTGLRWTGLRWTMLEAEEM